MKKLVLSLIISHVALLITAPVLAQVPFSASRMAEIQIPDLSFKELMRKFYSGQMHRAYIDDAELNKLPHIALGQADKNSNSTVALMHPVMMYQNTAAETRYFVMIEKIQVGAEGDVIVCHSCAGDADLYTFKKLANNQFRLVSRSGTHTHLSGSWGRVGLDLDMVSSNIQPLGKNLIGSVFQNGFSNGGTTEMWWEALHLAENDYIQVYRIADAGADNSGSYEQDSPLYYSYDGVLSIVKNGAEFFPIKVTYTGEKPSEDNQRIDHVNYAEIFNFDQNKQEYK